MEAQREPHTANNAPGGSQSWDPMLAQLGHGQWSWEPRLARWQLSPACAQMLGYGHAAITLDTESWLACVHIDDRYRMSAWMAQHDKRREGIWQCDFRLAASSEHDRWFLVRAATVPRDNLDAAQRVLGTCTEVSSVPLAAHASIARDARLAAALEQAQIAWFERDLATDIDVGSPSIAVIYGLDNPTGPWRYKDIRARIVTEDLVGHLHETGMALRHSVTDLSPRIMHYRIRRPDGEIRHIEVRYRNIYEGDSARAFGLVFDVTAAKALESKFQDAMAHARMAWFERDLVSDELRGSRSLWQLYGFDPAHQPLYFSEVLSSLHPDDAASHPADTTTLQVRSRALNGVPQETTTAVTAYRSRPPGQNERWLEVRYRIELDGLGGGTVNGLVVDVTATKHAEAAQCAADSRLRLALDAAKMASWVWDFESDSVASRDELGQNLGLPGDGPWTIERVCDAVHPDDRTTIREQIETARRLANDQDLRLEYRVVTASGDERWIEALGRFEAHTMYGIVIDVTARKHAELERDRLHKQLQQAQKMEAIGLLTGGIAHDFNNILASILGYSGLALQRFGDRIPDKLVDYLKEVQTAGGRARDLVAQMLAFSRGESGELEATNITAVIEQTVQMLRPTLPTTIEMNTTFEAGLPAVLLDAVQVQQVLMNLCINARDATAGSGVIELTLAQRQLYRGHCASCHREFSGRFIVVGVGDDGPGMSEALQARIFEPFFTTKGTGRGTGMGLAMVHGIVHRHQGHIVLHSAPDAGCRFEVLLPLPHLSPAKLDSDTAVDIASYPAPGPTAVLVIDDEAAITRLVGELLELNGYTVTLETDAERAWELFAAAPQRFDLVVTDQTMPRLSGARLAARMRSLRPALPVVMMTGYSSSIDAHKAQELGICAYLRKPVDCDALLAAVATALEQATGA